MSINFADVKISIPDGTIRTASISINGMDISDRVNRIEFDIDANEPVVFVKLTLLAKVELDGRVSLITEQHKPGLEESSNALDWAISDFMDIVEETD